MDFDSQYRRTDAVFGDEPEKILAGYASAIAPGGRALDVGAGQGRHSIYLAQKGYSVDAIDPSEYAMDSLGSIAESHDLRIHTFTCGFEDFEPKGNDYSAILLFGLVQILSWERIELLLRLVDQWLGPDGLVFITAFTTSDDSYARYAIPECAVGKNSFNDKQGGVRTFLETGELPTLFAGYEIVHHWEGTGPEHHHGDGIMQRHALCEAVLRKPSGKRTG